uniref:Uncharacterized protein n=1 Tax=Rhizophora mucronata TaxID=61149 RepID=A0A2P2NVR1_RHIMU
MCYLEILDTNPSLMLKNL